MKREFKRNTAFESLLKAKGMTAYKLSQELGYKDKYTVYKWIYGKGEPNAATMLRLTILLDVSAEEILKIFGGRR